jgi:two-component system, NtrC family, sensor kinase
VYSSAIENKKPYMPNNEEKDQLFSKRIRISWIYDLYRLGQDITSLDNASGIYQKLLVHFVQGLEGDGGCLALYDAESSRLKITAGIDLREGVIGHTLAIGETIFGKVIVSGKPQLFCEIPKDCAHLPAYQALLNRMPHSAICWPLMIEKEILGVISITRSSKKAPFTPQYIEQGTVLLNLVSLALGSIRLQINQQARIQELKDAYQQLEEAQNQLVQSEKMASIGQLAAGVAHEINNPIGYVNSNLGALEKYLKDLFELIDAYEAATPADDTGWAHIDALKQRIDLPYLREDLHALLIESKEGITRVKKIVQDLKDFSHMDVAEEWQLTDLHQGLESTLNIVANEIKYKASVVKEYGDLPLVECLPFQLNQVFMNLLVNAAQAIEGQGTITIRTTSTGQEAIVEIADTGKGISPDFIKRIFDPFFTTKPIGKGTGLGLSLSYGILQKHQGQIEVKSEPGVGTAFRLRLPLRQLVPPTEAAAG